MIASLVTVKVGQGNFLSDPGILRPTLRTTHGNAITKCRRRSLSSVPSPYRPATESTDYKAQSVYRVHRSKRTEEPL